ncbi:MAG: HAMP domain-containing protein [Anaerolineales bacterium]|nr:HAMP domain-containing protein [Anaerolineales bacterium]
MMRSLWLKLMGAFLLIVLIGGGIDTYLVSHSTRTQFSQYIDQNGRAFAQQLAPTLAQYYSRQGNWQGVEGLLNNPWGNSMMGDGMGMMDEGSWGIWDGMAMNGEMGMGDSNPWNMMGIRLLLADAQGTIVADGAALDRGKTISSADLAAGVPILVGNQQVGTLLPVYAGTNVSNPAGDFISSVNHSTWLAGVIAAVVALVLGSILFFQIVSPVQKLTNAAQKIAAGDLGQRIPTQSQDEIGTLATAFNQMADSLAQHEELRRNLIADVAHELRTPLTIIQGNLEAMLDGILPTSPEEIATLRDEAAMLTRLVTDLRLLSLAESGQLKLERAKINVVELITRAVEPFRLQAQSSEVQLNLDLASNLPPIEVDVDRMTQVMRNLLGNALRHTPAGGCVTVACQSHKPQELSVTVSDTGEGIPPDDLPYIFDRFYRADKSRSRASGGSGIGLAIVKQLVEAHGGRVWVDSKPGQGATFGFTLLN